VPRLRVRQLLVGMGPMLLLYGLYTIIRFLVADRGPVDGVANAYEVLHLEHRLGLGWETSIQQFTLPHEWLVVAANWYYVLVAASLAAMVNYQAFVWWRRNFVVTLVLALIGFAIYPLAPPRMLPGMVDTLMVYGPRYYGDSEGSSLFNAYGRIPSLVNVYAAMPSMHVAWSIIAGALLIASFRGRWWVRAIGIVHPTLMGVSVLVTANHYLLDVIMGVAALLGSLLILRGPGWWRSDSIRRRSRMEEHDSPDGALMAAGIVIVLALLGCVVMFLVAG
jgi:membrane-associated phospholipid phosphatase